MLMPPPPGPPPPLLLAKALAQQLHWPGVRQLWIATQRKGINVTKKQVEELVKTRGEKQIFGHLPKAERKSLAEDVDTSDRIWQI